MLNTPAAGLFGKSVEEVVGKTDAELRGCCSAPAQRKRPQNY